MSIDDSERSAAERELADAVRSFLERVVRPVEAKYAAEMAETGTIDPASQLRERRALRRRSAELGYYGMAMPEEAGGLGVSPLGVAWAFEEIGASGLLLADRGGVLPNVEGPNLAMVAMTPEQRTRYLGPLLRAEREGCFALTEPGAGSDATNIRTRAVRDGDEWVITGTKQFITHGGDADFTVVVAVTDPDRGGRGLTAFLVDRGTPGFSVGRTHRTLGEDRPVDLLFDDVRVPDSAIVGGRGQALGYAMRAINVARVNIAAGALGKSRYLLNAMLAHASTRQAFGRPIGAFQLVQAHIADSSIEIDATRGLVGAAAAAADRDDMNARRLAASAKIYATETVQRVADRAIQVHGGGGVTTAAGIERYFRDARAARIYEGTSEVLRANIAKWLGVSV
ncbi:acyl-CoA dehydrogenase family protein [Nocardia nova]|uniref:acyl-CoA dehydrogenase family protein n=1 Tax=Nocardia nova TaxID=37330 RepID=UPI0033EBBE14